MSSHPQRTAVPGRTHSRLRLMDQFLETNGLGGYACGSLGGVRQWPTQGMVVVAKQPPIDRYMLVNGFDVRVDFGDESIPISTNRFADGRFSPDGRKRFIQFTSRPWPRWTYDLSRGRILHFECLARHGSDQFVFSWHLETSPDPAILWVRPLISGRPINATRKQSSQIQLRPERPSPRLFVWTFPESPPLALLADGEFEEDDYWIEDLLYDNASREDLATPGVFRWDMQPKSRAQIIAGTAEAMSADPRTATEVATLANKLRNAERTRRKLFRSGLDLAADQYIVEGSSGKTLLSGFPLGTEKGSQALIATRGVCLSPGRLDIVGSVLRTWRGRIAAGMIPTDISEHRLRPSFHSAAPSLWYVVAAYEYIRASERQSRKIAAEERGELEASIREILSHLLEGRNWRAYMDDDGLLCEAATHGSELDRGERIKRVDVQALWLSSLWIGSLLEPAWRAHYEDARGQFDLTFWSEESGYLSRSIQTFADSPLQRDNDLGLEQILAVGGLPNVAVDEGKASLIVAALENRYFAPDRIKKATAFPWLFGPFIEAWYRIRFRDPNALRDAKERFIDLWEAQLRFGGHNHLSACPENEPRFGEDSRPSDLAIESFSAAETAELLRILHLPDLRRNDEPFDDQRTGLFDQSR